ncbi:MAG: 4-alpha-glucanotransferase, partial [Bacteroidaceae bacterium]|nr:4-alpha-glucanotransferase [Bacteroidaceae bacterium]
MTLNFSIEYRTEWGQSVEVELCFLSADGKTHFQRIPLETDDGLVWKGLCMLKARGKQFRYTYIIMYGDEVVRREWDVVPRLFPADDARTYFFIDHWRDVPESSYCYTDAYQVASGHWNMLVASVALFPRTFLFRVQAPGLAQGERVALVGDQPALGNWDTVRALPMMPSAQGEWLLSISADGLRLPFEYKYVITSSEGEAKWEKGDNRQSPSNGQWSMGNGQWVVALSDDEIRLPVPHWKVAGLVVPLFSLRTEGSQGIGDFGDLKEMADWAAQAGMHAIQLLPIYDTTQNRTFTDSYPYNAISVHALHPIYADLRRLPLSDKETQTKFQKRWQKLNALPALDYVEVIKLKEEYLHQYYEEQTDLSQPSSKGRELEGVSSFVKENAEWLQPYCVFCHLRDTYGTPQFTKWKKLYTYNRSSVTKYIESHSREVGYYAFVQYILHKQLAEATDHARSLRVFLKGDLPIGISPCSVEAWHEPHLFNMDMVAGAPPDDFSREGQNWGFPTYNWERMAEDGYL